MAAKCIECDNLADQHGLCHTCRRWYKKRLENVRIEKVVEMAEENEEEIYSLWCGKCGDVYRVSKEEQEKYKDVRWRCRSCLYAWI